MTPLQAHYRIRQFQHGRSIWFWNPFWGFFFQPVGPGRRRERIVKSGKLYEALRRTSGYL